MPQHPGMVMGRRPRGPMRGGRFVVQNFVEEQPRICPETTAQDIDTFRHASNERPSSASGAEHWRHRRPPSAMVQRPSMAYASMQRWVYKKLAHVNGGHYNSRLQCGLCNSGAAPLHTDTNGASVVYLKQLRTNIPLRPNLYCVAQNHQPAQEAVQPLHQGRGRSSCRGSLCPALPEATLEGFRREVSSDGEEGRAFLSDHHQDPAVASPSQEE